MEDKGQKHNKLCLRKRSVINMEPMVEETVMVKPLCDVNQGIIQSKPENSRFSPISPACIVY